MKTYSVRFTQTVKQYQDVEFEVPDEVVNDKTVNEYGLDAVTAWFEENMSDIYMKEIDSYSWVDEWPWGIEEEGYENIQEVVNENV